MTIDEALQVILGTAHTEDGHCFPIESSTFQAACSVLQARMPVLAGYKLREFRSNRKYFGTAEDLCQDVWIKLMRVAHNNRTQSPAPSSGIVSGQGYLNRTFHNLMLSRLRKKDAIVETPQSDGTESDEQILERLNVTQLSTTSATERAEEESFLREFERFSKVITDQLPERFGSWRELLSKQSAAQENRLNHLQELYDIYYLNQPGKITADRRRSRRILLAGLLHRYVYQLHTQTVFAAFQHQINGQDLLYHCTDPVQVFPDSRIIRDQRYLKSCYLHFVLLGIEREGLEGDRNQRSPLPLSLPDGETLELIWETIMTISTSNLELHAAVKALHTSTE